jgi:hypothetical protein
VARATCTLVHIRAAIIALPTADAPAAVRCESIQTLAAVVTRDAGTFVDVLGTVLAEPADTTAARVRVLHVRAGPPVQAWATDAFVHILRTVVSSPASGACATIHTTAVADATDADFAGHASTVVVARGAHTDINLFSAVFALVTIKAVARVEVEIVDTCAMVAWDARAVRHLLRAVVTEVVRIAVARVAVWHKRIRGARCFVCGRVLARMALALVNVDLAVVSCVSRLASATIPIDARCTPARVLAWCAQTLICVIVTRWAFPPCCTEAVRSCCRRLLRLLPTVVTRVLKR